MTIYDDVIAAGIKHDSHHSDLYLPVNEQTSALIRSRRHSLTVSTFRSQIDGKLWYDLPFCFDPYWHNEVQQ